MNDPFAAHGISHLSASSLNTFIACPAYWIVSYLYKTRDPFGGPAASRGQAVEDATYAILRGTNPDQALAEVYEQYDLKTRLDDPTKADKERKAIEPMVLNAVEVLKQYGPPDDLPEAPDNAPQGKKISVTLDGIECPIIGYTDFSYSEYGFDLDMKSTAAVPSKIKPSHGCQFALYERATNWQQKVCYTGKSRAVIYELSEQQRDQGVKLMTHTAHVIRNFLSLSGDKAEIAQYFTPNFEDFRWGTNTIAKAKELWELQ